MTEEVEAEVGDNATSVLTEHVDDVSGDKQTCSTSCSVTIDQMVRDFIIAKTKGISGNDQVGDGKKPEQDCKHKSDKDKKKKKKKKKKKHKSHHKESSSKHRRRRHGDHRSSGASAESSSSDEGSERCVSNAENVAGDRNVEANLCVKNDDSKMKDVPLTSTGNNDEYAKTSVAGQDSVKTTETLNFDICSKCSSSRQINTASDDQKTPTRDVQYRHLSPAKTADKIISKNKTVLSQHKDATLITDKLHRSNEVQSTISVVDKRHLQVEARTCGDLHHSSHNGGALSHRHSEENRKLTKDKRQHGVSSNSRHRADNDEMSDSAKKQHSTRERRGSRDSLDHDRSADSRKSRHSLEKSTDRRSLESGKSDDVVFVKKVSAREATKSSSCTETVSNTEKLARQQKPKQRSGRGVAVDDSSKRGSKHKYDISSDENESVPKYKMKKDGKQRKESPVILLSDDDVDILSDEMVEKLHKRLTTSIKKSKELQAEYLKTSDPGSSHDTAEVTTDPVCRDTAATSAHSDVVFSADAAVVDASHGESAVTCEQSAVKPTPSALFGKKTLKFGLKISESSAAWISKGIKNSETAGKEVLV